MTKTTTSTQLLKNKGGKTLSVESNHCHMNDERNETNQHQSIKMTRMEMG